MPNPDPYLKPGLTPNTDVELYASESAGGYTKAGTGIANGVAAGGSDITYTKAGTGTAEGAASGTKSVTGVGITHVKVGTATALASASGASVVESGAVPPARGGGSRRPKLPPWSPSPRRPTSYAKTGTAVALAIGSGSSDTASPRRRKAHKVLLLEGAF